DDEHDATTRYEDVLPHQYESTGCDLAKSDLKKQGSQAGPEAEADCSDCDGLQENHPGEAPVRHADGFQGAKLFQVFESEEVEGLSGNDGANNHCDSDGDTKIDRYASIFQVVPDAVPSEFICSPRAKASLGFDPPRNFLRTHTSRSFHQNIGELCAFASDKIDGLAVSRMDDRITEERSRSIRDADDHGLVVIEFQGAVDLKRLAREKQDVAGFVEHDGIWLAKPFPRP